MRFAPPTETFARIFCCMSVLLQAPSHAEDDHSEPSTVDAYRNGHPRFNEKEQALWRELYTGQKLCMKRAGEEALDVAAKEVYRGTELNGPGDAVRHCVWSCEMTRCVGASRAKQWGDAHEGERAPSAEKDMDLKNNETGRQLWGDISKRALGGYDSYDGKCRDACEKALADNKLKVLEPESWR